MYGFEGTSEILAGADARSLGALAGRLDVPREFRVRQGTFPSHAKAMAPSLGRCYPSGGIDISASIESLRRKLVGCHPSG
jgi:hypothetical protein